MANIKVQPLDSVDVSGAQYSQPPVATDPSGAARAAEAEALGTAVEAGIDIFKHRQKKSAEENAEIQSKSLLEEFTGYERKQELNQQLDTAIDAEDAQRIIMDNATPGSLERDMSATSLAQIEKTKDTLEKEKLAVDQGLLTFEEFRRRAESLFYQQVVQTPGLKAEIAVVMGEYLGIDPRGQTAAIEIENRKAAAKAEAAKNTRLKGIMMDHGFWVVGKSDEWNVANMGQAAMDYQHAQARREHRRKNLDWIQQQDEVTRKREANLALEDLHKSGPTALRQMAQIGDMNLLDGDITLQEMRTWDEDTRATLVAGFQQIGNQYKQIIHSETYANDQIGDRVQPLLQAIDDQVDLLSSIVMQEDSQELLEQKYNRLKTLNDITVQSYLNNQVLTQKDAVAMAAMREVVGETNLLAKTKIENIMLKLFQGNAQDLLSLEEEERGDTLAGYEKMLQSVSRALDSGYELDETQQNTIVKQLSTMSRHQSDELNSKVRQQMNRLATNEDLMKMFKQVDERGYRNFSRAVVQHQRVELDSLQEDMENKRIRGSRYYLKEEDGHWLITPTSMAVNKQTQLSTRGRVRGQNKQQGDTSKAEQALRDPVKQINATRGLITNMIKSRALVAGIPESEAARQVAEELGLNLKDVTETPKQEEKPGFGEGLKKKGDE